MVSVPVSYRYSYLPTKAVTLLVLHLPPSFNKEDTPRVILEMAGYTVLVPSSEDSFPLPPPEGCVLLLRYRNGKTPSHHVNASTIVIDVLPPAGDPFLRHLPPRLSVPGWGEEVMTILENDPFPKVRRVPAPHGHLLPEFIGAGWFNMDEDIDLEHGGQSPATAAPTPSPTAPPSTAAFSPPSPAGDRVTSPAPRAACALSAGISAGPPPAAEAPTPPPSAPPSAAALSSPYPAGHPGTTPPSRADADNVPTSEDAMLDSGDDIGLPLPPTGHLGSTSSVRSSDVCKLQQHDSSRKKSVPSDANAFPPDCAIPDLLPPVVASPSRNVVTSPVPWRSASVAARKGMAPCHAVPTEPILHTATPPSGAVPAPAPPQAAPVSTDTPWSPPREGGIPSAALARAVTRATAKGNGHVAPIHAPHMPVPPRPGKSRQPPLEPNVAAARQSRRKKKQEDLEVWGERDRRTLAGDTRTRSDAGSVASTGRRVRRPPGFWWLRTASVHGSVPDATAPLLRQRRPSRSPDAPSSQPKLCRSRSRSYSPSTCRAVPSCPPAAGRSS